MDRTEVGIGKNFEYFLAVSTPSIAVKIPNILKLLALSGAAAPKQLLLHAVALPKPLEVSSDGRRHPSPSLGENPYPTLGLIKSAAVILLFSLTERMVGGADPIYHH